MWSANSSDYPSMGRDWNFLAKNCMIQFSLYHRIHHSYSSPATVLCVRSALLKYRLRGMVTRYFVTLFTSIRLNGSLLAMNFFALFHAPCSSCPASRLKEFLLLCSHFAQNLEGLRLFMGSCWLFQRLPSQITSWFIQTILVDFISLGVVKAILFTSEDMTSMPNPLAMSYKTVVSGVISRRQMDDFEAPSFSARLVLSFLRLRCREVYITAGSPLCF